MIVFYSVLIYSCVLSTLYLQQYMVSLVVAGLQLNTTGNPSSLSSDDDPSFSFLKKRSFSTSCLKRSRAKWSCNSLWIPDLSLGSIVPSIICKKYLSGISNVHCVKIVKIPITISYLWLIIAHRNVIPPKLNISPSRQLNVSLINSKSCLVQ